MLLCVAATRRTTAAAAAAVVKATPNALRENRGRGKRRRKRKLRVSGHAQTNRCSKRGGWHRISTLFLSFSQSLSASKRTPLLPPIHTHRHTRIRFEYLSIFGVYLRVCVCVCTTVLRFYSPSAFTAFSRNRLTPPPRIILPPLRPTPTSLTNRNFR